MSAPLDRPALGSPVLGFALEHFEKGLFVLACLALGLAFSGREPQVDLSEVETARRRVEAHFRTAAPGEAAGPRDRTRALRERLEPALPSAGELPAWSLHRRPGLITTEPTWSERRGTWSAPALSARWVEAGLELSWTPGERSAFLRPAWRLERRAGEGPWEPCAPATDAEWLPEDQRTHLEAGLTPGVAYRYRLRARVALDPVEVERSARRRERLLLPSQTEGCSAELGPYTRERALRIQVRTVWPADALAGRPGAAYLMVYRQAAGAWLKSGFRVEVGAEIGAEVQVGREVRDFRSGARLLEVRRVEERGALGQRREVGLVRVRWPDGVEEELRTDAAPPR